MTAQELSQQQPAQERVLAETGLDFPEVQPEFPAQSRHSLMLRSPLSSTFVAVAERAPATHPLSDLYLTCSQSVFRALVPEAVLFAAVVKLEVAQERRLVVVGQSVAVELAAPRVVVAVPEIAVASAVVGTGSAEAVEPAVAELAVAELAAAELVELLAGPAAVSQAGPVAAFSSFSSQYSLPAAANVASR